MSWPPHITVAAIVEREGRFLLVEEEIDGERVLNQPAGHLEPGETLEQAVQRETLEETGWRIRPTAIGGIYQYHAPGPDITYHRIAFIADALEQTDRELDPVIRAVHWLTPAVLASGRLRSPLVMRCIEDYQRRGGMPLEFISHIN